MKVSALNVDFNSASFDPLGSGVLHTSASNLGIPLKCAISATVD